MATPTDEHERRAATILHFADRVLLVFSYFSFTVEFKSDRDLLTPAPALPTNRRLWVLPNIRGACLGTTLMMLRDIDDFLTPRSKDSREDDLKASDLGFKEDFSFLSDMERKEINKRIIHSTAFAAYQTEETPWDVGELTMKGVSQSLHFLKWVQTHETMKDSSKARAAAHFYATIVERIIDYARKLKTQETPPA